jgi:arylsulfatase A-like enzyme
VAPPPPLERERCFPPGLLEGRVDRYLAEDLARFARIPDAAWSTIRANYYGMVSHVDWCVGRLLDGLERLGQLENTLIVFISDHGEYLGDHRMLYKGPLLFDGEMRVPCIMAWGDRLVRGRRVRALAQEIDVFPTVVSLLGLPVHAGVQGRDLSPMLLGAAETGYTQVTGELDPLFDRPYSPTQVIRGERWKLHYWPTARTGMLFDLQVDPEERYNLYSDAGYAGVRDELLGDLIEHHYRAKDPLPVRLSQA